MRSSAFLRVVALALVAYGLVGLAVSATVGVVGYATFAQVSSLRIALDRERTALASSLHTVAGTVGDAGAGSADFVNSVAQAQAAAQGASTLAADAAVSFQQMSVAMQLEVLGFQPLAGLAPGFAQNAQQLQQLSTALASTADALGTDARHVQRVGADLTEVRGQVEDLANTLDHAGVLVGPGEQYRLLQIALFALVVLAAMQSLFSLIAGIALYRLRDTVLALAQVAAAHMVQRQLAAAGEGPPPVQGESQALSTAYRAG